MNRKRAVVLAAIMLMLLAAVPSAAFAGWCGPYAPENHCEECADVNSDCGGDTCFAEKIGVCREALPQTPAPTSSEYAVPRSEPRTRVSSFSATSGAPDRAGTSLGCDRSSTIFTARGPDFASEQRSQAMTRRGVCSATYSCYLGGTLCFISEYSFPSETELP